MWRPLALILSLRSTESTETVWRSGEGCCIALQLVGARCSVTRWVKAEVCYSLW